MLKIQLCAHKTILRCKSNFSSFSLIQPFHSSAQEKLVSTEVLPKPHLQWKEAFQILSSIHRSTDPQTYFSCTKKLIPLNLQDVNLV